MTKTGEKTKYFPDFRIYKPKQTGDGAASRLQVKVAEAKFGPRCYIFWETVKQTGFDENKNASFAWKDETKRITMKLEEVDVGELLSVLNRQKEAAGSKNGLYHQTEKGNTVMSFARYAKEGMAPSFALAISRKNKGDTQALKIQHMISMSEAMVLKLLLEDGVLRLYGRK